MSKQIHPLAQSYVCVKCRGRQPDVREIAIAKTGILDILPGRDNRYIEVTCTLCGYTEFYNRAVYLASLSPEEETEKLPLPQKANGG